MEKILAFLIPTAVYSAVFLWHILLPGRQVTGYVTKSNSPEKLRYRLNGLLVLLAVVLMWVLFGFSGLMEWDWLYVYKWYTLAGAVTVGLLFSLAMVLPYPPVKKWFLADFYLGRLENPQFRNGRIDAKMLLYLAGAVMLELNIVSFTAHHCLVYGASASPGIYLTAALLTFFVIDYLTFEEVHLYTYDFLAERVGFKLGFGCLAFYPFFYAVPLWVTADLPDPQTPVYGLVVYTLVFLASWSLSRGANMQKYFFKKDPERSFLGLRPKILSDGSRTLLVNGFWGLSRHINYFGEIGMAVGIVLCAGHPLMCWPWLYPMYYIALLLPRQIADDKRCARKYGTLWEQYKKKVPYRIIPYLY